MSICKHCSGTGLKPVRILKKRGPVSVDMTGRIFGKWTVLEMDESRPSAGGHIYWICECECGIIKSVIGRDLRLGKSTQCRWCPKRKIQ